MEVLLGMYKFLVLLYMLLLEKTGELVDIIKKSIPTRFQNSGHPAKKTFQAIRIEVNSELKAIEVALPEAIKRLKVGGRICVITFIHKTESS